VPTFRRLPDDEPNQPIDRRTLDAIGPEDLAQRRQPQRRTLVLERGITEPTEFEVPGRRPRRARPLGSQPAQS
jgi:hypothetical protein